MQQLEWATWNERARKHEFQAITAAWGTGVDPDLSYNLWHSSQYDKSGKSGRNYGGYKNARVDELYEQGRVEFDREKRAALYGEVHRLIYDDQPYTFLYNRPVLWALHGRIQGVSTGPRGVFGSDPSILGWWVKPGAGKYVTASAP